MNQFKRSKWHGITNDTGDKTQLRFNQLLLDVIAIIILSTLFGCSSNFTDNSNHQAYQIIDTPEGEYRSVAWLTDELIAFNYGQKNIDHWSASLIALHKIGESGWSITKQLPEREECLVGFISYISRLSNGRIGFVYFCMANSPSGFLHTWDINSDTVTQFYDYPDRFFPTSYTFSPTSDALIQTDSEGSGMNDNLFRVTLNPEQQFEELFPTFQRKRNPAWSPDGKLIAFAGTETYPGAPSSDFTTFNQITGLLDYPWDIYLLDVTSGQHQLLFSGTQNLRGLKWSPADNWLAFSGVIERKRGIWILDIKTRELIRVWHETDGYFDWSPDGSQMVVIDHQGDLNASGTYDDEAFIPLIIDIAFTAE